MTAPKPIPQVPAALVGLFPGAHADLAGNRYQATEEFEAGVWQFKYRTNHGVQYITMSCHDMALLLDSPLALCHATRWLAGRHGYDPGVTAPVWWTDGKDWVLEWIGRDGLWTKRFPVTDPGAGGAEALAAACVAVGAAPA